jgi:hypothetical protein
MFCSRITSLDLIIIISLQLLVLILLQWQTNYNSNCTPATKIEFAEKPGVNSAHTTYEYLNSSISSNVAALHEILKPFYGADSTVHHF